ncbi:MAG: replication initiator protein A [Gammaproteobacteria bacterium]|nr:replication initiator protein A [Gammaproteobacteria bacterium]MBU1732498.1 replication initiator protein A [Gammaproteobacteria bacterium]MBU1892634.1 replication initiator protein A [Gammaproteobacteria bacterium]
MATNITVYRDPEKRTPVTEVGAYPRDIKDILAMLDLPIFSLSLGKDSEPFEWNNAVPSRNIPATMSLEVDCSGKLGRANLQDKMILVYAVSILATERARGNPCADRKVRFQMKDLLSWMDRSAGGKEYANIERGIDRLLSTTIFTNIRTGGKRATEGFHLLESKKIVGDDGETYAVGDPRPRGTQVELVISEWVFRSIATVDNSAYATEILKIAPAYVKLRSNLEKRLYEIARRHVGHKQRGFLIGIEELRSKCGSKEPRPDRWKKQLKAIIAKDTLPEFYFKIEEDRVEGDKVRFFRRIELPAISKTTWYQAVRFMTNEDGSHKHEFFWVDKDNNPESLKSYSRLAIRRRRRPRTPKEEG